MGAATVGKVGTASNLAGLYGINGDKKPETSLEFQKIIKKEKCLLQRSITGI